MLSSSGLVIIKKHKITAKKNKEIPSTLEELRYIVNANVGINTNYTIFNNQCQVENALS